MSEKYTMVDLNGRLLTILIIDGECFAKMTPDLMRLGDLAPEEFASWVRECGTRVSESLH